MHNVDCEKLVEEKAVALEEMAKGLLAVIDDDLDVDLACNLLVSCELYRLEQANGDRGVTKGRRDFVGTYATILSAGAALAATIEEVEKGPLDDDAKTRMAGR